MKKLILFCGSLFFLSFLLASYASRTINVRCIFYNDSSQSIHLVKIGQHCIHDGTAGFLFDSSAKASVFPVVISKMKSGTIQFSSYNGRATRTCSTPISHSITLAARLQPDGANLATFNCYLSDKDDGKKKAGKSYIDSLNSTSDEADKANIKFLASDDILIISDNHLGTN